MHEGKQVLRYVNNCKTKDSYLICNDDSERTKFNVHYKDINKNNLY